MGKLKQRYPSGNLEKRKKKERPFFPTFDTSNGVLVVQNGYKNHTKRELIKRIIEFMLLMS